MTPGEYIAVLIFVNDFGFVPASPFCPRCGEAPEILMGGGHQAFCASDGCDVLTWDPAESAATFEANARPVTITEGPGQ